MQSHSRTSINMARSNPNRCNESVVGPHPLRLYSSPSRLAVVQAAALVHFTARALFSGSFVVNIAAMLRLLCMSAPPSVDCSMGRLCKSLSNLWPNTRPGRKGGFFRVTKKRTELSRCGRTTMRACSALSLSIAFVVSIVRRSDTCNYRPPGAQLYLPLVASERVSIHFSHCSVTFYHNRSSASFRSSLTSKPPPPPPSQSDKRGHEASSCRHYRSAARPLSVGGVYRVTLESSVAIPFSYFVPPALHTGSEALEGPAKLSHLGDSRKLASSHTRGRCYMRDGRKMQRRSVCDRNFAVAMASPQHSYTHTRLEVWTANNLSPARASATWPGRNSRPGPVLSGSAVGPATGTSRSATWFRGLISLVLGLYVPVRRRAIASVIESSNRFALTE
ncbi:unnamed protein product [Protopolystoma xenopodis]|uniref:Uncharacterized protein n=1 Tax=Protopolystoma xenopodis TaxID=117903 RepID=A0A448XF09_9PLAT|nr:unnamed protein product [Protopolystoma xenopodis]